MTHSSGKGGPEFVGPLMRRFIYLNQLRVRVISLYFAMVAALFAAINFAGASSAMGFRPFLPYLVLLFLFVGLLVFGFDLRCRARSSRVAQGIRVRVADCGNVRIRESPSLTDRLDEDLLFSAIVMLSNAALTLPLVTAFSGGPPKMPVVFSLALIFFVLQLVVHVTLWPRLAAKMDEWPDDSLLEEVDSEI